MVVFVRGASAAVLALALLGGGAWAGAEGGPIDWEAGQATDRWIVFRGAEVAKVVVDGYFDDFTAEVIDDKGRVVASAKSDPTERRAELRWTPPARGSYKVRTEGSGIKRLRTN